LRSNIGSQKATKFDPVGSSDKRLEKGKWTGKKRGEKEREIDELDGRKTA